MKEKIVKSNSFVKKNILRLCFIIVFASTFWSCTKYETYVSETKIVETRVSEVDSTSAKLTIVLSGDRWLIDDIGLEFYGYINNLTVSWQEDFEHEFGENGIEYLQHIEVGGLLPGMTYNWRPCIYKDTIIVYGEFLIFTTKF